MIGRWLAILCCLALTFVPAAEGRGTNVSVTIGWATPQTNEDGTTLTDMGGHRVYHGTSSGNYNTVIDVGHETAATITGLVPHRLYYFAVTAYDTNANESDFSAELVWAFDDVDVDGMSDAWEANHFGGVDSVVGGGDRDIDGDGVTNLGEYLAGTDPIDPASRTRIRIEPVDGQIQVSIQVPAALGDEYAGYARFFSIERCSDIVHDVWTPLPEMEAVAATGQPAIAVDAAYALSCAFRVLVWLE